jgi:hypothetical protein
MRSPALAAIGLCGALFAGVLASAGVVSLLRDGGSLLVGVLVTAFSLVLALLAGVLFRWSFARVAMDPSDPATSRLALAAGMASRGRLGEALDTYGLIARVHPHAAALCWLRMAEIHRRRGDLRAAIAHYHAAAACGGDADAIDEHIRALQGQVSTTVVGVSA